MKKITINTKLFAVVFFVLCFLLASAQSLSDKEISLEVKFINYVGDSKLMLDSTTYKNELNQEFTVTKFKYYIGQISLFTNEGIVYKTNQHYLIDEENPSSKRLILHNIPNHEYTGIFFNIGVDSTNNCSGAQSGSLDPLNGMFWTWNTGYIFMKLEGFAEDSSSPLSVFEYHIGGYRSSNNSLRTISLNFDRPNNFTVQKKNSIAIKVDILEILKTPTTIDFSKLSSVTGLQNATTIANNYMDMFSIINQIDGK